MAMAPRTARARHPWPPPTPTPHNTTPHHTPKFTKNIQKMWPGTTQKQQQIEENHVLWHPWAIPGHSWVLLGRPRGSKGEKVTKNMVREFPSRDLFWNTFRSFFFCLWKSALLERVFCESLFLLNFGSIFGRFSTPWNHKNTNSIREWHRNQENQKIAS